TTYRLYAEEVSPKMATSANPNSNAVTFNRPPDKGKRIEDLVSRPPARVRSGITVAGHYTRRFLRSRPGSTHRDRLRQEAAGGAGSRRYSEAPRALQDRTTTDMNARFHSTE